MNIILGITGSVAATLTEKIVRALFNYGHFVRIIATEKSLYFFDRQKLRNSTLVKVWSDKDDGGQQKYQKNDPVLHIEFADWADALLICPLSANTLAKISNGQADNLLTCVARAWDLNKPMVLAPAMNTKMWNHPITREQLNKLRNWYNINIINPISKELACGEKGIGALADINDIVLALNHSLKLIN